MLSSTKLGEHFVLPSARINQIFAELGWIEKYVKGWVPTQRGNRLGAEVREMRNKPVPYVVWPEKIIEHRALITAIADYKGDKEESASAPASNSSANEFRQKFPAEHRATDGHMVRSRGEMLIDNWLYMQEIVHAVERRLPIDEDVYCDFYLPAKKVYIEYWGLENDPKYAARKEKKIDIYRKYDLNLVEIGDADISNLDDVLPRHLIRFGIDCT